MENFQQAFSCKINKIVQYFHRASIPDSSDKQLHHRKISGGLIPDPHTADIDQMHHDQRAITDTHSDNKL